MKPLLAALALITVLAAWIPAHAQNMPPENYMDMDKFSEVYAGLNQYQQAVIAALNKEQNDMDRQLLMTGFCLSHSMIVMLDHVSRCIGYIYATSQLPDPHGEAVAKQMLCLFYTYDATSLAQYSTQLAQIAANSQGDAQQSAALLGQHVDALGRLISMQKGTYCSQ